MQGEPLPPRLVLRLDRPVNPAVVGGPVDHPGQAGGHLGFEADQRNYELCAGVLRHFGVSRVRLMSNNPQKFDALEAAGIRVIERIPIEIPPSDGTQKYLETKKVKMGHLL